MAEEIKSSWAVCSVCGKEFEIVGNRKIQGIDCRAEERAMGEEKESHAEKEKGCKRAKVPK